MRSALHTAAHFLTETNLFIAVGAALFASSTYGFLGLPPNGEMAATVFCGTLFTYNFQRWAGDLNQSAAYRPFKVGAMAVAGMALLPLLWQLPPAVWVALGVAGALSVAYALPTIPAGAGPERYSLRRLPHFKIWVILAAWLLAGVVAPMLEAKAYADLPDPVSVWVLMAQQGAFIFALTAAFDIRDLAVDTPAQKTLPHALGVDRTRKIALQMLWFSLLAAMANYLFGTYSLVVLGAHGLSVAAAMVLLRATHPQRPPLFFTLLIDGVLVVQGVLVWWAVDF